MPSQFFTGSEGQACLSDGISYMTKSTNKKIDSLVRKEKWKKLGVAAGLATIVSIIFVPLLTPNLGESSKITGEVVRLFGKPTDEGTTLYLIVVLNDGSEVRSFINNTRLYKKGGRVNLLKKSPLFIGRDTYTFQGYIKE